MNDFISLRGYAIAFNRTIAVGADRVEVINRRAFDWMLDGAVPNIPLVWGSHEPDAPKMAKGVTLFVDGYGLGFHADIDMRPRTSFSKSENFGRICSIVQKNEPFDQCSVGGFEIAEERPDRVNGIDCTRVMRAKIGHISITSNAVYRGFTGVWPTHCSLDQAPARIQSMARSWELGWRRWQALQQSTSAVPTSSKQANVSAFLAPRQQSFAMMRSRFMAAARSGTIPANTVLAHAAFTKAAGWRGPVTRL